jgi:hypothetical protein
MLKRAKLSKIEIGAPKKEEEYNLFFCEPCG